MTRSAATSSNYASAHGRAAGITKYNVNPNEQTFCGRSCDKSGTNESYVCSWDLPCSSLLKAAVIFVLQLQWCALFLLLQYMRGLLIISCCLACIRCAQAYIVSSHTAIRFKWQQRTHFSIHRQRNEQHLLHAGAGGRASTAGKGFGKVPAQVSSTLQASRTNTQSGESPIMCTLL
jgi:hypothetical protein